METGSIVLLENGLKDLKTNSEQLDVQQLDVSEVSHRWTVLPARSRSAICRTSFLACAFVVCVHLFLVYTIDVGQAVDRIARQQASIILPGSAHSPNSQQATHARARRDLATNEELSYMAKKEAEKAETEKNSALSFSSTFSSSTTSSSSSSSSASVCRSGHIQGFNAVCDAQPCLRRLQSQKKHQPPQPGVDASQLTSPQVLRRISHISGRLDTVHFSIIPFIAHFQWSNGMYGSVGEFGVSMGKFTSLLSTYTDVEAGEKLFACDCFNRSGSLVSSGDRPIAGLSPLHIFTTHMRDFGFEENAAGPKKLHLYRGSSSILDRTIFSAWDLPQFRLISIDDDLDRLSLLSDLEMATCLLRDGGVIVVNGVDDSESKQMTGSTLASFFRKHGHSALSPILSAGNKLYLTTTNWRRKYIEAMTSDVILLHSGLLQSAVIDPLAPEHPTSVM